MVEDERVSAPSILVVDDDRRLAASIRRALAYEGYRVSLAEDGPSAFRSARESLPDLVILDVMMPGMDGGADDYLIKPFAYDELVVRVSHGRLNMLSRAATTIGP